MNLIALFQSDKPADWAATSGLKTVRMYPTAVVQAELATVRLENGRWLAAEKGESLAETLPGETWLYVNPWWLWERKQLGGQAEWLRMEQWDQAEKCKAWLQGPDGGPVLVYGGKMRALDATNQAYRDWLSVQLSKLPGAGYFLDCGWYYQSGYHPGATDQAGRRITDTEQATAKAEFYMALRAAGKRVIANAAWEMFDPLAPRWAYPYSEYVDGVAIEVPGGQRRADGKWWDVVSYRPHMGDGPRALERLQQVVRDWQGLNKEVWIIARWDRKDATSYTYSPWATFAEHASWWMETATSLGCDLAVHQNTGRAELLPGLGEIDAPRTTEQRLTALERRVGILEKALY